MNNEKFEQLISLLCGDLEKTPDLRKVKKDELAECIKMLVLDKESLFHEVEELKKDNDFKTSLNKTLMESQEASEKIIEDFKKMINEVELEKEKDQKLVERSVTNAADCQDIASRMTRRFKLMSGVSIIELILIILLIIF